MKSMAKDEKRPRLDEGVRLDFRSPSDVQSILQRHQSTAID